jgi:hypothetical protein
VAVPILSRQLQISLTCINTTLAPRLDLQTRATTLELFTADPSHSAGNTDATEDNSLHLAISYAINAKSQELQLNRAVQIAELNLLARQRGTATWRTRNASSDETHRIRTILLFFCESFTFHLYCIVWSITLSGFWCFRKEYGGIRKINGYGGIHFHRGMYTGENGGSIYMCLTRAPRGYYYSLLYPSFPSLYFSYRDKN